MQLQLTVQPPLLPSHAVFVLLVLHYQGVLRELRASRVQGLTQLVLHLPASHPMERLDLSCCNFLRLVDVALPQLVSLNLSACRTLYRLRMR